MSTPYSIMMARGILVANTSITAATVPAAVIWIVRSIDVTSAQSAATTLQVGSSWGTGSAWWAWLQVPATGASVHWDGRQVMNAGDNLILKTGATQADYYISGYQIAAS